MKKALIVLMAALLGFGLTALADIQFGFNPDDDDDRLNFGDGNEAIFGAAASFRWEDADANANCFTLELPTGGSVDVPVFAIGIGIDDVDLGLFNGLTQTTFGVVDSDRDSAVYVSFSADDVGVLAGKGSATSFGITFATITNTASTTLINYTPAYVIGYDAGAYMSIAVSDTTGSVAITHAGATKAVTWTAAGGFSFVGDFAVTGAISGTTITGYAIGTDVQAYDAELAALAALTFADDYFILGTGAGTIAMASCTAFAQTVLDDADAAAVRTTLGLTIGTNVQAYDAELAALAALTFADDYFILGTGAGTVAVASCTAFAQTVLDDADAAAAQTTLGVLIGTNVQAYDADLAALAGVTSAANAIPYFTGSGTASVISSSANMISLLGSATYLAATQALDVEIGVDVQAYDADLAALAGVTSAANAIPYFTGSGTAGVISSSANMVSLLGSATYLAATQALSVEVGVDVQAYDADLTTYAGITPTASAQTMLGNAADGIVLSQRHRVTIGEINAGHTILPAISGKSYRIISATAIAYGDAVAATTTVDLLGTQSAGSVKLCAYAQASLTQSAVLQMGDAGAAVQADGASFAACDANTAVTVGKTGADVTTATGVDFIITYVIE